MKLSGNTILITGGGCGVQVLITAAGRSALEDARPVVSQGIRKYFLDQLTEEDISSITNLAARTKPVSPGNLPPS